MASVNYLTLTLSQQAANNVTILISGNLYYWWSLLPQFLQAGQKNCPAAFQYGFHLVLSRILAVRQLYGCLPN